MASEGNSVAVLPSEPPRRDPTISLYATLQTSIKFKDAFMKKKLLQARQSINRSEQYQLQLNTKLLEAVENGAIEDISKALEKGANSNATCKVSDVTACHLAALLHNDSLSLLIKSGAEAFRFDKIGRLPLHLAAWAGNLKQIAMLLEFPVDLLNRVTNDMSVETESEIRKVAALKHDLVNTPCQVTAHKISLPIEWKDSMAHNCVLTNKNLPVFQRGWTALHCACARAQYFCVRLLLAAGADFKAPDADGRVPLDVIGEAHYMGYPIDVQDFIEIIELLVKMGGRMNNAQLNGVHEVNTPLHTAVELESEMAVRKLLELGASAACLNSRGLSAMHLCVEKQFAELLELLVYFEYSDQDPKTAIVDVIDTNGQTVLNAAVRARWHRGVHIALAAGADSSLQAYDGNAPIHAAAVLGKTSILQGLLAVPHFAIDLQNISGQTALFLAIIHNNLKTVKLLIENGASLEIKEPYYINVIHVVAQHGYTDILKYLLNYVGGHITNLINERCKRDSYPPIVYAVDNNNPVCVKLLLEKNAQINISVPFKHEFTKKEIWTTPLHIAATKNHCEIAKIMLEFDSSILNLPNSIGWYPLHEACVNGNRDIITLFINYGVDLSAKHETKTAIQMLMDYMPNPTDYMEDVLDNFISCSGESVTSQIIVNYKVLLANSSDDKQLEVINALLNTGNAHDQKKLLQHPLIESFIYLKWKSLLPFFYTTLVLYGLFVLSLNVYIVSVFFYEDKNKLNLTNVTIFQEDMYPTKAVPQYLHTTVWKYMIYITVCLLTIQELILLKLRTKRYCLKVETWVKFGAIALAMFLPSVVSWRTLETVRHSPNSPEWVRLVATIAILLSWVRMMYLVARLPSCGHYALMLGNVTVKVLKVLLSFGVLIIGISLCFLIQFRAQSPFEGLWATFTKTLVMMTSEFDYTSTINKEHVLQIDASIILLRVMIIIFVIFASIVLMNIMVGVAVNDVNHLEKIGTQKRLQKQVGFLTSLEDIVCNALIDRVLPKIILKHAKVLRKGVNKEIVLSPYNAACKYNSTLPRQIKEGLYEKAQLQVKHLGHKLDSLSYGNKLDEIQNAISKHDEKLDKLFQLLISKNDSILNSTKVCRN